MLYFQVILWLLKKHNLYPNQTHNCLQIYNRPNCDSKGCCHYLGLMGMCRTTIISDAIKSQIYCPIAYFKHFPTIHCFTGIRISLKDIDATDHGRGGGAWNHREMQ